MSKKTVLFDFDGVIVDSFELCYQAAQDALGSPIDRKTYRGFFDGNIYVREDVQKTLEDAEKPRVSDPFFVHYIAGIMTQSPVVGIENVLQTLCERYRLLLITSTINAPVEQYLKQNGLDQMFDHVYGADVHKSKEVKIGMAFEEFDFFAQDCVFVTDTVGDILEARKKDVSAIAVDWGFHDAQHLKKATPLSVVASTEALEEHVLLFLGK